jgi:TonB family protein
MLNKLILVLTISILSLNVSAAKTYNLTIKVISMRNHKAMEGFKVSTIIDKVIHEIGVTDANGEIVIHSLSEKSINVEVIDPENIHRKQTLYYYNPKKVDEKKEIRLRLNRSEELKFFKELDTKYMDNTEPLVNQIPSGKSSSSENDTIDFIPASPVGGVSEFFRFIAMNIEYPQDCIENNIQGRVYLSFIVQEDGTITNVNVEKGVSPSLDEEACRVIRYFPKWNCATSNGKPIRAIVKTPVNFTLN